VVLPDVPAVPKKVLQDIPKKVVPIPAPAPQPRVPAEDSILKRFLKRLKTSSAPSPVPVRATEKPVTPVRAVEKPKELPQAKPIPAPISTQSPAPLKPT